MLIWLIAQFNGSGYDFQLVCQGDIETENKKQYGIHGKCHYNLLLSDHFNQIKTRVRLFLDWRGSIICRVFYSLMLDFIHIIQGRINDAMLFTVLVEHKHDLIKHSN